MTHINEIMILERRSGVSPAEVYKCQLKGMFCYLKKIDNIFSATTCSIKRKTEIMK